MSWSPVRYADQRALPVVRVDRSSRRLRLSGLRASASGRWRLSTISCTARSAQCWPARAPWQSTWSRHGWRRRRWGGRLPYYASCSIHRLAGSTGRWPLSPVASPPGRHCVGRCPHWHSGLGRRASAAAICPRSPGTGAPSRRRGSAVRRHEETTGCTGRISGKRSVPPSPRSAEQRDGVAADLGGEHVAEVGKEGAALQAAGDRGREQSRDGALALLGLAAQRELAVDHRAAQATFGVVVGRLDAGHAGEAPEGRPALQQVLGEGAVAAVTGALSRRLLEQRAELLLERVDTLKQARAVSVRAELCPGCEQPCGDPKAGGAELLLGAEALAVGAEVAHQVRPAELTSLHIEVVVGPPAVRAGDAGELLAEQRLSLALVATLGDAEDGGACSDRWWAYDYLDAERRQLCWAHLARDLTAHSEGLGAQKQFGAAGLGVAAGLFAAWAEFRADADRAELCPGCEQPCGDPI